MRNSSTVAAMFEAYRTHDLATENPLHIAGLPDDAMFLEWEHELADGRRYRTTAPIA